MSGEPVRRAAQLARAHAVFNIGGGLWPLVHMPSFEAVTGPKTDRWLVRTVAGLMVANGLVQWLAEPSVEGIASARRVGQGTAVTLAAIDIAYAIPGRISRIYLLDALLEVGWVAAWARTVRLSE
ncbi:MAG TPA: hypothetical protein VHH34_17885 [Pseudonocardiaceae bacterium]|nr:hypothetical protein [Pseudonocardiaceae bacterium]